MDQQEQGIQNDRLAMFKDEWITLQGVIDSVGAKIQEDAAVSPHVRRAASNFLFIMEQAGNYLLGTVDPIVRNMGKAALEANAPSPEAVAKAVSGAPKGGVVQFPTKAGV